LAVQALAGVLLPSATVFLLLLCNDKPVLGPWVNPRWLNYFTSVVIAALVILSIVLTASVLFPESTNDQTILGILTGGAGAAVIIALVVMALGGGGERAANRAEVDDAAVATIASRNSWRMPPLDELAPAKLSLAAKTWMGVLRVYLVLAVALVLFRFVALAVGGSG
jgi:branched-subunit amino acid transport protein